MAEIKIMKKVEIDKEIGMNILRNYLENDYGNTISIDEEVYFEDLSIKNSIIFLEELDKQLAYAIADIIKKYEEAEEILWKWRCET